MTQRLRFAALGMTQRLRFAALGMIPHVVRDCAANDKYFILLIINCL